MHRFNTRRLGCCHEVHFTCGSMRPTPFNNIPVIASSEATKQSKGGAELPWIAAVRSR